MQRLEAAHERRIGRFIAEASAIESDEPFPRALLAALQTLVPCDSVIYSELDRVAQRSLHGVMFPAEKEDESSDDGLDYWGIRHLHPVCNHQETTGDWRACRLSDFVSRRQLRSSRVYDEWFRPLGVSGISQWGSTPRSRTRSASCSSAARGRTSTTPTASS